MSTGIYKRKAGLKRRPMSKETRRKIRLSRLGKFREKSNSWKGDKGEYMTKHAWFYNNIGKASKCENKSCKFKNPKRYEWANISREYKRELNDWIQLCPSCHRIYDFQRLTLDALFRGEYKK
jgi:hypothetical protein